MTQDYLPQDAVTLSWEEECQRERKWQSMVTSKAKVGAAEQNLAHENAGSYLVF